MLIDLKTRSELSMTCRLHGWVNLELVEWFNDSEALRWSARLGERGILTVSQDRPIFLEVSATGFADVVDVEQCVRVDENVPIAGDSRCEVGYARVYIRDELKGTLQRPMLQEGGGGNVATYAILAHHQCHSPSCASVAIRLADPGPRVQLSTRALLPTKCSLRLRCCCGPAGSSR